MHAPRASKPFKCRSIGPVADDAAAGQRDGGFLFPAEQRAEHADGRAHFAHDVVRRLGVDLLGLHRDHAAGPLDLRAEVREDLQHVMDVAQVRDV